MTLALELGGIHDPNVRRALEVLSQQFPVVATGGGGGPETDPVASPALATHAALTTGAHGGIVASSDARLTDARAPTAHKTTHEPGGSDPMTVDAVAGTGSLRTLGTAATSAAAGNRGLPTGGTAAQVLTKNSGTDYDAGWAAVSGGGGGSAVYPWAAVVAQAADVTNATTTNVNTDLVFSFEASSTYIIDLYLMITAAATTTGVAFAWDTSVAVTTANLTFEHQLAAAGTLTGGDAITDDTVRGLSSGVPVAAAITPIIASGIVISTTNAGTARLRFRPEVAASATFKAGSTMRVMKVGGTTSAVIPTITGRVNAVGTIAAGTGFTITKGAAGLFDIVYPGGFTPVGGAACSAAGGANRGVDLAFGEVAGAVRARTFTMTTSAAADYPFTFVIYGS